MQGNKYKIAELEAQLLFMKKFINKIDEKNSNIIPPTKEEIAYMRQEVSDKIYREKGMRVNFE